MHFYIYVVRCVECLVLCVMWAVCVCVCADCSVQVCMCGCGVFVYLCILFIYIHKVMWVWSHVDQWKLEQIMFLRCFLLLL